MRLAVVAGIAAILLGGCSSAVPVPPASSSSACAALLKKLPANLNGATRRPVDSVGTFAWGDPAIWFRCGVPAPAGFGTGLIEVDGVAWFPVQLTNGYRFTARTAAGYVEVTVPAHYSPAADQLLPLAPALR